MSGHDAQRNLAIDAAEGEVVDLVAEGRNVRALGGVELHGKNVVAGGSRMRRQIEGERRVTAFVLAERGR